MDNSLDIDALLRAPHSSSIADQLVNWADKTRSHIIRGDMMLGILTQEVVAKIPLAYETAALSGDSSAWVKLAWWHALPEIGESDIMAAESALGKAIEAGVPKAEMELVKLVWFFKRESATESEKQRTYQFLSSFCNTNAQDAEAHYFLGLLTCDGFGTTASPERAFALHQMAANLGNAAATFELSIYYIQGTGVRKDMDASFKMCQSAAEAGHARAMYNLGAFYASGQCTPKSIPDAVKWYQRAADAGNPSAMVGLAAIYATGDGVEVDLEYVQQCLDQAEYLGLDVSEIRRELNI